MNRSILIPARMIPALLAVWLGVSAASAAVETYPIPASRESYGWAEKQRVRFRNQPLDRAMNQALAQQNYEQARDLLEQILTNDPKNDHARVRLIEVSIQLEDYARAQSLCDELLAAYPDYWNLYLQQGFMAMRQGQPDAAVAPLQEVVDRGPAEYEKRRIAVRNLAEACYLTERYPEAAAYGALLLPEAEGVSLRSFLAECAIKQMAWADAVPHLEQAIALADTPAAQGPLLFKLGYVHHNLAQYDQADDTLARAAEQLTDPAVQRAILLQRGETAFKAERYEQATAFYEAYLADGFEEGVAAALLNALIADEQYDTAMKRASAFLAGQAMSPEFEETTRHQQVVIALGTGDNVAALGHARKLYQRFPRPRYLLEEAEAAEHLGLLNDAIRAYKYYLDERFDPEIVLRLHFALKHRSEAFLTDGRSEDAGALRAVSATYLTQVLDQPGLSDSQRYVATYELAQIFRAADKVDAYFSLMDGLVEQYPETDLLHEYAVQLYGAGRYDEALELFTLSLEGMDNPSLQAATEKAIADIHLLRQEPEEAKQWLQRSADHGPIDRYWNLAMARADYQLEDFHATAMRLIPIAEDEDIFHMYVGFAFYNMAPRQMPGLALYHFSQVTDPDALPPEQRHNFYANRAYLRFDQNQDEAALEDLARALELHPAEELSTARMKTLMRLGRYEETLAYGEELVQPDPNEELRAEILALTEQHPDPAYREAVKRQVSEYASPAQAEVRELLGLAHFRLEQFPEAVEQLDQALALDPTLPQAFYVRGLAYYRQGKFVEAESDFLALYDVLGTLPSNYWGDLGVLEGDLEDYDLGTAALERSLDFYPYDIDALEEQGYQFMRSMRRAEAQDSFSRAIDLYTEILPYMEGDELAAYDDERHAMKQEYAKLDRVFGVQAYLQRTELDFELPANTTVNSTEGALQSQAGIGASWRPPSVGFRNERELDVYGRVMANLEPNSWSPDEDSYQGGVGVQWKPLGAHNVRTSFERLFKIGDNSEDNWLWRNMYAWEVSEKPRRYGDTRLYNRLYGEISYYLDDPKRWIYYLSPRVAPVFSLTNRLVLNAPEFIGVGRYQSNDPDGIGTYAYVGVGGDLRLLDWKRQYTVERWYLDVYAHYVWGWFNDTPEDFGEEDFEGVIFGLNFTK